MAGYKVYFKVSVEKDLRAVPGKDLRKILQKIRSLGEQPRPPDCEKLTGQDRYRVRQGRYRIIYSIEDKVLAIFIVAIGQRKDIYR